MNYDKPDDFIPERWYKNPDLIKHKEAFAPFTIGESETATLVYQG